MPTNIGIVGANGKVGSEVTLLLNCMEDLTVVPIVRSEYAGAFLETCDIRTRVASSELSLKAALRSCDAVVDLTSPLGAVAVEFRESITAHVRELMAQLPNAARFVFASSIMAFGMGSGDRRIRHYRLSRTSYGAQKRRAEREVRIANAGVGRESFVLRLGEVHGDLQPVTGHYVDAVRQGPVMLRRSLDRESIVVTCYTIANAVRNIALGRETPGLYTLVEQPAWSWRDFFRWIATNLGTDVVLEVADESDERLSLSRLLRHGVANASEELVGLATRNKDILTSYLPISAEREYRLKIQHLTRRAALEVAQQQPVSPHDLMIGPPPGQRLRSLGCVDDRQSVEQCVRKRLDDRLGPRSHHFPTDTLRPSVPRR
jgi:nucleoside-diphosphate-sugar epimerase